MAGNIPLVGFHDFLCGFLSGHIIYIKASSKDTVLITHLVRTLASWDEEIAAQIHFAEMLKGCDAYIATGTNNSARYFEQYFSSYPHIIRRNRTFCGGARRIGVSRGITRTGQRHLHLFRARLPECNAALPSTWL